MGFDELNTGLEVSGMQKELAKRIEELKKDREKLTKDRKEIVDTLNLIDKTLVMLDGQIKRSQETYKLGEFVESLEELLK